MSIEIRPFEDADWPAVYSIYREVVEAGETHTYDPNWSEAEARAVWIEPEPGRTVVAVEDGSILGTAHVAPNKPGRGSHVSTASFMIGSAARGRGLGRELGEHILGLARADGYHSMQFNAVVAANTGAVHLWKALGFEIVGTVPDAFDHPVAGLVPLYIMYREL